MQVLYQVSICKLFKVSLFKIQLQDQIFNSLLRIRPIFKTLALHSIFLFGSICDQSFCHNFIVVCHSITLHTASKSNHKHNNQKQYGLVINKHS